MTLETTGLSGRTETPSGKGASDENFPVGSRLIAPALRPAVMAFYDFARAADDVADNPALTAGEKLERLDLFEAGLDDVGPVAKAHRLGELLQNRGVTDGHARALLNAFRQDATTSRYETWQDLLDYCALSANPVGRFLMDLHEESTALWTPSDGLCTALQVLNHLQDCTSDYREMDRVYLPLDMLTAAGVGVDSLDGKSADGGLRSVIDLALDRCDAMIDVAGTRPARMRSWRLDTEMRVITALARRLSSRLRRDDPVARRVELSKTDFAVGAVAGLCAAVLR